VGFLVAVTGVGAPGAGGDYHRVDGLRPESSTLERSFRRCRREARRMGHKAPMQRIGIDREYFLERLDRQPATVISSRFSEIFTEYWKNHSSGRTLTNGNACQRVAGPSDQLRSYARKNSSRWI